jgi:formate-dependent nitrite reductase membrane component NrfD
MGVKAMTSTWWTGKEIALIAAIVTFACAAAFLSVKLTRPKPFVGVIVNPQWQCTGIAGIRTVCVKKHA